MPLASPVAFPLFPIVGGKCACDTENCGRVGKHPAVRWAELKRGDAVPTPTPGAGFGLKTGALPKGSDVFVVDLDGPEAVDAWLAMCADFGVVETFTVKTPRGVHLYFRHPGFHVPNSASSLGKGIDVRGDGGFVVGPGSPHRSGGSYELVVDVAPAPAPEWLLEWLKKQARPVEVQPHACDVTDPTERARRRELYRKYLRDEAPARGPERRGKGDQTLFEVVQRGAYDLALPTVDVLEDIREHYDPRCSPMWGDELEERVLHKANDAKTRSTRPRIEPLPADSILERLFLEPPPRPERSSTPQITASSAGSGFKLVSAVDLSAPLPPVVYVVQHFGIARGRPALFAGYGGLGKTVVAQALALHIASGMESCWGVPVSPGAVLHFDYEMTREPLQRRYQRLAVGHGIDLASCDLHLCSMPEIYLSDERAEDELCKATENVSFAIVDNLAAATATAQTGENESGIRRYLDRLTRVTAKTGCAFMVLAHERKGSVTDDGSSPLQRVRGSSAITDACGSVVSVAAAKTAGILTLSQTKASLRRGGDDVNLQIRDIVLDGMHAREGEDSPGLQIARVGASAADQEREAKARVDERAAIESIKLEMMRKLTDTTFAHIGKQDLLDMIPAMTARKKMALAELINVDRRAIEYKEGGRKVVKFKPD